MRAQGLHRIGDQLGLAPRTARYLIGSIDERYRHACTLQGSTQPQQARWRHGVAKGVPVGGGHEQDLHIEHPNKFLPQVPLVVQEGQAR
jgi:hypothetical protein